MEERIPNGISVVVCCFNSADRLPKTLKFLAEQVLESDLQCELVVVDNCSVDDTTKVAQEEWERLRKPFPLTIVSEPTPGLSHARKKGVEIASFGYICFCDDDNWLCDTYLQTAVEIMNSDDEIGVLAGQGLAVGETDLPNWFYSYYGSFACGVLSLSSGDVSKRGWVWGAGMVLRRAIYLRLIEAGFEHMTLDRVGSSLTSGGDNELCYWHVLVGLKLWYDERLTFQHWMPADRLTKEYLSRLSRGQDESRSRLAFYKRLIKVSELDLGVRTFFRAIADYLTNNRNSAPVVCYFPFLSSEKDRRAIRNVQASIARYGLLCEKFVKEKVWSSANSAVYSSGEIPMALKESINK